MTTNVFDGVTGYIATDSRWSYRWANYLVYIDDSGYEKIELTGDFAFMFAGKGERVEQWKTWIRSNPADLSSAPADTQGMSVCVVSSASGAILTTVGDYHVEGNARFGGTGRDHARACWVKNSDPLKCVKSAILGDRYSGGEVKFFKFSDKSHNLYTQSTVTLQMVNNLLLQRGMAMSINDNKILSHPVPFKQAAANDVDLGEFQDKVASGAVSPEAPFDGMTREWTRSETDDFHAALAQVFGWKK